MESTRNTTMGFGEKNDSSGGVTITKNRPNEPGVERAKFGGGGEAPLRSCLGVVKDERVTQEGMGSWQKGSG